MARYSDKQFTGTKKDKKEVLSRKRPEKERFQTIAGWSPTTYHDDLDIATWMNWQKEGCFRKRKPTKEDDYRNLPTSKCSAIDNVTRFENDSLSEKFGLRKSFQVDEERFKQQKEQETQRKHSAETVPKKPEAEVAKDRQCQSAHASIPVENATVAKNAPPARLPKKNKLKPSGKEKSPLAVSPEKDKIKDEDEDVNDDGYASKISSNEEDNGLDIRPVPLLDLVGVSDQDPQPEKNSSFRWLREKDGSGNNKITKLTYSPSEVHASPQQTVNRNDIINSSKAFVTDYIKRYQPQDQRPKSLFLSKVGIQDGENAEILQRSESVGDNRVSTVITKTNPELNVSNLTTEAAPNRSNSRQSLSRATQRRGSRNSNPTLDTSEKQSAVPHFPVKDLLPAVDKNIHSKQQERYTRHSVEEYYGKIGCGTSGQQAGMSSIEALSRSLDKHMGPPAFRPHYLRSPLQRAREQNTKRFTGNLTYLAPQDGSESHKITTPRFYVDKTMYQRSTSADSCSFRPFMPFKAKRLTPDLLRRGAAVSRHGLLVQLFARR